ncbi:hypothetical protein [Thermus tengchongensis]|uniref:hypothetical protein n=1 Tax=Thermus tengchongensis TaxID=1214928 RepID=UPI00068FAAE5|nr:hypothetical protein [Thermus tengchongensis]
MWPFGRKPSPKPQEPEEGRLAELAAELAKAQEEIAFLKAQNTRLTQEAAPALKENAVLRYELFKCQSDRQVLEFHLSGLRAELGGALALLHRLAPGEPPRERPVLEAFLDLLEVGRRLGVEVEDLAPAEALAREALGEAWTFQAERFLALRLSGILAAIEHLLGEEVRRADHPGEALAGFPKELEGVRQALAKALARWGNPV